MIALLTAVLRFGLSKSDFKIDYQGPTLLLDVLMP